MMLPDVTEYIRQSVHFVATNAVYFVACLLSNIMQISALVDISVVLKSNS